MILPNDMEWKDGFLLSEQEDDVRAYVQWEIDSWTTLSDIKESITPEWERCIERSTQCTWFVFQEKYYYMDGDHSNNWQALKAIFNYIILD